jgi:hypothetical protein
VIDAEIDTATHHLAAKAVVSFTAPENSELVSFGFHPGAEGHQNHRRNGKLLTGERSADGTIRVTPARAFVQRPGSRTGPSSTRAPSPATRTARSKG